MSKEQSTFPVSPLDARNIKRIVQELTAAKAVVDRNIDLLRDARSDFDETMLRLCTPHGIDPTTYRVNVATNLLEPIPEKSIPQQPLVVQPAPPAPFRDNGNSSPVAVEPVP